MQASLSSWKSCHRYGWRRPALTPAVAALALIGAGASPHSSPWPFAVTLVSESNAGIHGTAILTPVGQKTEVSIALVNDPVGARHPAHIHQGACGQEFNPLPRYPLNTVVDGKSMTIVDALPSDIVGRGLVIEVHSSKYHVNIIAACGSVGG